MSLLKLALTALIGGGTGALDKIDGAGLSDGDAAVVVLSTGVYHYHLNATSGAAENSPYVIAPDSNPGTKRWILVTPQGAFSHVRVEKSSVQAFTLATPEKIEFDTEIYDELNEFDPTTNYRFTATYDGYYDIKLTFMFTSVAIINSTTFQLYLYKNGAQYCILHYLQGLSGTINPHIIGSTSIKLDATDYIEVFAFQSASSPLNSHNDADYVYLTIDRIA